MFGFEPAAGDFARRRFCFKHALSAVTFLQLSVMALQKRPIPRTVSLDGPV